MDTDSKARERAEVIQEFSKWSVGAGILVVALAPLAIPILVLTGVALLPLLVPLIPLALIAGLIYLPVRLVRRRPQAPPVATPGPGRGRGARPRSSSHRFTTASSNSSAGVRSSTSRPAPRSRSPRSEP